MEMINQSVKIWSQNLLINYAHAKNIGKTEIFNFIL